MDIVPPFDQIMRPLLEVLTDGHPHQLRELSPRVGDLMGLSQTAREECLASGALRFPNRLYWAKLYLKQAGAIEDVDRGIIRITERGRELLRRYPRSISQDALMEFEEFRAFVERSKPPKDRGKHNEEATLDAGTTERTPLEVIQSAYQELREAVVQELLEAVRKAPPAFLERLTVKLMMRLGYGDEENVGLVTGGPGDGGIDGIIPRDRLGLSNIYLQAKRYQDGSPIGADVVQRLAGSMQERGAQEGVLVTTSSFTPAARESARRLKIALIDGQRLAEMMFAENVGTSTEETLSIKRVDQGFFELE